MNIIPISAFNDNYIWMIQDDLNKVLDCVDPGLAAPVLDYIRSSGMALRSIIITHHHQDHIGGVEEILQLFPHCQVYGPKDSRINHVTHCVHENETITIGCNQFTILSTPGHTSSHICYFERKQKWLFCGDTLFSAGCGRVFDGSIEQLYQSLIQLNKLPPETLIYCAHEYTFKNLEFAQTVEPQNLAIQNELNLILKQPGISTLPSTLAKERLINPFLRLSSQEVQEYALSHGVMNTNTLEVFKLLRHQKNNFP